MCCIGLSVAVPVAQADEGTSRAISLECDAGGKVKFNPGLLPTPQTVQASFQGTNQSCNDLGGNGIVSGTFKGAFSARMSCELGAGNGADGTARIEWEYENGQTAESVASVTMSGQTLNQGRFTGHITEGPFVGDTLDGTFSVDLASGAFSCTAGAPFGGLKEADFTGSYTLHS